MIEEQFHMNNKINLFGLRNDGIDFDMNSDTVKLVKHFPMLKEHTLIDTAVNIGCMVECLVFTILQL